MVRQEPGAEQRGQLRATPRRAAARAPGRAPGCPVAIEQRSAQAQVDLHGRAVEADLTPPEPEPAAAEPEPEVEVEPEVESEPEVEIEPEGDVEVAPEPEVEPEVAPEAEPDEDNAPDPSPAALAPPVPPADLTLPPSEEYAGATPAERVTPATEAKPEKKVLIDSVPWRTLPDKDPLALPPAEPGEPAIPAERDSSAADGPTGPDNWGMTGPPPTQPPPTDAADPVPEPVAEPAAAAAPPLPAPAPAPAPDVTMDRSSLSPDIEGPSDSPVVLAVICPAGHHSSPHASECRVCGRDIPTQQPFQTPRPQLGSLRVSAGGLVPLDRGILLGRAPRVNADLPPSSRPHLVRLASQDNDISRNHAEIILEGWHVLVRDLGSTNGTTVTLPGQEPVRLRPTEDFGIEPGAILTLADEVSLTYEVSE